VQRAVNVVCGVNVDGMRRASIPNVEIDAVSEAFRMIYIEGLAIPAALARMEAELGYAPAVRDLAAFIRSSKRGICGPHRLDSSKPA
jgi:UDP-N-acetylglucosamine acyltransferase